MASSWRGLQHLLDVVILHSKAIHMSLNACKSVHMVFHPRDRRMLFSSIKCWQCKVAVFASFQVFGHMIVSNNADDADIQREVTSLSVGSGTNILIGTFSKCFVDVKIVLFKAYCRPICLYDVALWKHYNLGSLNKLCASYNRCIKMLFGFRCWDSLTNILVTLGLPSFETVIANAIYSFICAFMVRML